MANTCKRVYYRGDVQGVGFRHSAWSLARNFDVGGYVRNLPDGRVELLVEGEAAEVGRFLEALTQRMAGHIHEQTESDAAPAGHTRFEIST